MIGSLLDPIDHGIRPLTEEFAPRRLDAGIVLRGLDEIHEPNHSLFESARELHTDEPAVGLNASCASRRRRIAPGAMPPFDCAS